MNLGNLLNYRLQCTSKSLLLLIVVITIFSPPLLSQSTKINGIVVDKTNGKPIEDVYVAWERGQMVLTDSNGTFSINISQFPVKLTLSHISYGLTEILLPKKPEDPFFIRLDPKLSKIGEVQISGERLRVLTEKDDFSIIDFQFDKNYLWMLGFVNNQANKQKLFLANPYADTIRTINISRGEKLYKDAFNNVHLLTRDSAHQLFYQGDSIEFLYSSGRKRFEDIMSGILCGFSNKLVFKDYIPQRYNMHLYYLTEEDYLRHHLTYLIDSNSLNADIQDNKRDNLMRVWGISELGNMWTAFRSVAKPGTQMASIVFPPIPMGLFTFNDSLFVMNFIKDSLLCYSPEGKFVRSVHVDFHYEKRLAGIDYKELKFITDPITSRVFITERRIARWILHPFDTQTGKLLPEILLPDFAGMTNIQAYNDAIYFLYHEKLYPYYTRMFRYQL